MTFDEFQNNFYHDKTYNAFLLETIRLKQSNYEIVHNLVSNSIYCINTYSDHFQEEFQNQLFPTIDDAKKAIHSYLVREKII